MDDDDDDDDDGYGLISCLLGERGGRGRLVVSYQWSLTWYLLGVRGALEKSHPTVVYRW